MRFFALSLEYMLIRYFLMMACVIGGLFVGQPLIAFLALPLFLSAILGVSFRAETPAAEANVLGLTNEQKAQNDFHRAA
ncbi:MAG: hypothetical protein AAGF89_05235 [Bacteroidota bacterium]